MNSSATVYYQVSKVFYATKGATFVEPPSELDLTPSGS